MKKILPFVLTLLILPFFLKGQDPHFTQFYMAPLQLNPALTGVINGNFRVNALYRGQWGEVLKDETVGQFRTIVGGADFRIPIKRNAIGIGVDVLNDKAAQSAYGTTRAGLSMSYLQNLDQRGRHYIVLGLQADMIQRSFDLDALRFGNQWNGLNYDPTFLQDNPAYLAQLNQRFIFFDASAGLLYFMQGRNKRVSAYGGFSALHVNQPNEALGNTTAKLPVKFSIHSGVNLPLTKRLDILPKLLLQFQGQSIETIFGTDLRILFDEEMSDGNGVRFGALYRLVGGLNASNKNGLNSESLAFLAGVNFFGLNLGVSYDLNISQFTVGTLSRGAFEVGLIYVGSWKSRRRDRTPCPIF